MLSELVRIANDLIPRDAFHIDQHFTHYMHNSSHFRDSPLHIIYTLYCTVHCMHLSDVYTCMDAF